MKIYTEKEFDQINWNPKPYEFENLKKQLLENAKSRILKTYEENRYMYDLSYYFENYSRPKYNIECWSNCQLINAYELVKIAALYIYTTNPGFSNRCI